MIVAEENSVSTPGTKNRVIHCFGDSHSEVFDYIERQRLLKQSTLECTSVGGATALGLMNRNSKTDALSIFSAAIEKIARSDSLLFMLGEVDCGFIIWYRANQHGTSPGKQLDISIRNYGRFLRGVKSQGFGSIIVCTVHPPSIKDGQDWGKVANLRREVRATQRQRTELTHTYNSRLLKMCLRNHFMVMDIEPDVTNENTKLLDDKYVNRDPLNHHLDIVQIAPVYARKLKRLGFR